MGRQPPARVRVGRQHQRQSFAENRGAADQPHGRLRGAGEWVHRQGTRQQRNSRGDVRPGGQMATAWVLSRGDLLRDDDRGDSGGVPGMSTRARGRMRCGRRDDSLWSGCCSWRELERAPTTFKCARTSTTGQGVFVGNSTGGGFQTASECGVEQRRVSGHSTLSRRASTC